MPATSLALHAPSATSSISTGDGADDRWLFVSSGTAWPDGVMPRNKSSLTNFTVAFTPGAAIAQENNIRRSARYHVKIQPLVGPHHYSHRCPGDALVKAWRRAWQISWSSTMTT